MHMHTHYLVFGNYFTINRQFKFVQTMTMSGKVVFSNVNSTILVVGAILCCITGTVTNMIAITAILRRATLRRKKFSPLFFCQSFVNLFISVIWYPLAAVRFYKREHFLDHINPKHFCPPYALLSYGLLSASATILALIGLQRALQFKYPEKNYFTWSKTPICLLVLYCIAGLPLLLLPVTRTWGRVEFTKEDFDCAIL